MTVQVEIEPAVGVPGGETVRQVHGEGGLADPRHAVDGQHGHRRVSEHPVGGQEGEFGRPAGEGGDIARQVVGRGILSGRSHPGFGQEPGVTTEDALMQFLQGGARPGAELVDESFPCLPVGRQRVRLAPADVQRPHEKLDELLVEGEAGDQFGQFRDQPGVVSAAEFEGDALDGAAEHLVFEVLARDACPGTLQTCQWFAAPQVRRFLVERKGVIGLAARRRCPGFRAQSAEPVIIDFFDVRFQYVRPGNVAQVGAFSFADILEAASQAGDVSL